MFIQINRELVCILGLSLAFMLLFAADFSMMNMQKVVVSSIADDKPDFKLEGYYVTAILYAVFAIFVWIGPYITYRIGPKLTMLIASFGYLMYIGCYSFETVWLIYFGAVVGGIAAGILWPAQGQYIIENSSPQTTARNFAIFLLLLASAHLPSYSEGKTDLFSDPIIRHCFTFTVHWGMFGNIFVYTAFYGKKYLNEATRKSTIYSLVGLCIVAIFAYMCLPKTNNQQEKREYGPIKTLLKSFHLLVSRRMLWLAVTFVYAGIQQAFWQGIYSASIGFTLGFGSSVKELIALSGIVMGVGSLLGSLLPIVLAGLIRRHRFSRRIIVLVGVSAQLVTYLIAFVNLPDSSVFGNTNDRSLFEPNATLAMLGSVLLTIGDASLTTQIYAFIGDHYRDTSAEACALYKFVKGAVVSASFYVCSLFGLHTQLPFMAVAALVGVVAFWVADNDNISHDDRKESKETIAAKDANVM